jgi:hypothetical protein
MPKNDECLKKLLADFDAAGISTENPGFYEDFAFIRCEHKDPNYFENYARFVEWQKFPSKYLERAEQVIHFVIAEMQLALQLDASRDTLFETPFVMSRILEREGVFNYVVHGALTISFPPALGFEPISFWTADVRGSALANGYQWLCAPPFHVIDMTIQSLQYPCPITHLVPRTMMANDAVEDVGDPKEILSPAAIEQLQTSGGTLEEGLDRYLPGYRDRIAPDFCARLVTRGETKFKYVPTSVMAPEHELETFKGFTSKGRTAIQLYDEDIRPRLLAV